MPGARHTTLRKRSKSGRLLLLDWGETGTTFFVLLRVIMDTVVTCLPLPRARQGNRGVYCTWRLYRDARRRDAQSRLPERILKERCVRICNTIRRSQGRVQYWVNESFPSKRSSHNSMVLVSFTRREDFCWMDRCIDCSVNYARIGKYVERTYRGYWWIRVVVRVVRIPYI